jgi:hypothetical protein
MGRFRRTIKRLRRTWSELDYAQRRLMEIRTGLELSSGRDRRQLATTVAELEQLYALELEEPRHVA